ncbi:hypothetical protein [Nocardia sp. NPDC049707]|uniref:hypothetical protein n=1 Tax=Nocardia sp. NPDC049707 TaxID=3154735 RepID=UPI0034189948
MIELALSERAGTAERSRALHLLGLRTTTRLRVLAASGDGALSGRSARLGTVRAVLTTEEVPIPAPGDRHGAPPTP